MGNLELSFCPYNLLNRTKALVIGAFSCFGNVIKILFPQVMFVSVSFCMWPHSLLIQICSLHVTEKIAPASLNPIYNLIIHGTKVSCSLPLPLCHISNLLEDVVLDLLGPVPNCIV
jgi:hypothetical protein